MLIGFTGRIGVGKDEAVKHLVQSHGFTRIAFADKVKECAGVLLDISVDDINQIKNSETVRIGLFQKNISDQFGDGINMRKFIQILATEMGRNIISPTIWIDLALRDKDFASVDFAVTDCRFPNEVEAIHEKGGVVVRINRVGITDTGPHESESYIDSLDVDVDIYNNETIELFHEVLDELLGEIK